MPPFSPVAPATMDAPLPVRAAYFVSDGTGVTAETLGNALLVNFPGITFERHTIPFVDSEEEARRVVERTTRDAAAGLSPIVFITLKQMSLRSILTESSVAVIDLLAGHLTELEQALGVTASTELMQFHGIANADRYFQRIRAVEYAMQHDDGQSATAPDLAEVVIIAPSRCGKTPTTMYMALQHGILVANYPLTDDDFPTEGLPRPLAKFAGRCFGLTTTPMRLSQVRNERRPNSRYASLEQCTIELRRAEDLYLRNGIPFLNSSTKSVEEMSAVIMRTMNLRA
ncbi:pyruvate, water dikinase regulatory protein [Salinibacterium sp. GXW1014]|uniref:pyruvate, water dikinase regulatory protein n=1 Tax=Salinibacterium sp. GXW1014 TaxID=3377838 RepID=UPI00383AA5E6